MKDEADLGTPNTSAPLSNTNKEKVKSAKVKDFYSSLLNKRKGDGGKKKTTDKPEANGAEEPAE